MPKSRQTVREYVEEWLAAIAPTVRLSTHYSYGRNLRLHVVPRIGSAQLAAVDAGTLNRVYAALLADERKDHDGGGLSPRTVRYIHTIIHGALRDAVRWGRWPGTPQTQPTHPRPRRLADRSRSRGRPSSCEPSSMGPGAVALGPRTFCCRPRACDAGRCWGCAGLILTLTPAAHRSGKPSSRSSTQRCSAHRRQRKVAGQSP